MSYFVKWLHSDLPVFLCQYLHIIYLTVITFLVISLNIFKCYGVLYFKHMKQYEVYVIRAHSVILPLSSDYTFTTRRKFFYMQSINTKELLLFK